MQRGATAGRIVRDAERSIKLALASWFVEVAGATNLADGRHARSMTSARTHKLTGAASGIAIALGAIGVVGRACQLDLARGRLPGLESIRTNAALALVLGGTSVLLQLEGTGSPRWRTIGRLCGLVVLVTGLATLAEFALDLDLGIDQLVVRETLPGPFPPGRMAPNAALCATLAGAALVTLDARARALRGLSQALATGLLLVGFIGVMGYLLRTDALYRVDGHISMALSAVVGFLALAIGVLAARPHRGVVAVLAQDGPAGLVSRRLLPTLVGAVLAGAWLVRRGQQVELYDSELALALLATVSSTVITLVVLGNARLQGVAERAKAQGARDERLLFEISGLLGAAPGGPEALSGVLRQLGEYLAVSRCVLIEINMAGTRSRILHAYQRGVDPLAGPLDLTSFAPKLSSEARAGRVIVNDDAAVDVRTAGRYAAAYQAIAVRAYVAVPLHSGDRWAATLLASAHEPRTWQPRELRLIQTIAEQTWLRFEQLETEQRFRMFVDAVKDHAIFLLDPDGLVTTWNAGAERLSGYRADEIVGQHLSRFYTPEDLANGTPQRELEIAARDGSFEDEGWRVRRDGSQVWVNVVISALRGPQGELVGFGRVTRDLTEHRRAREQFRLALEAVPTAMLMMDPGGRIVLINAATEALFGYRRQELLGEPVERLMPDRFRGQHGAHRGAFKEGAQPRRDRPRRDLYGLRKDGGEIPIELGLTPFQTAEGDFVLGSIVDITERQRSLDQLRLAIEAAPTGMLMVDKHGEIVLVNAQVEVLFGYPREALVGESIEVLVPARLRHQHAGLRAGFFQHPQFRAMGTGPELYGLHRDGREIPIEIGLNPLHTEIGDFVLSSIQDITERKCAQQALRESEDRLRMAQSLAGIGTFEWNLETGVNLWTPEMEAMHGLPTGGFSGTRQDWQRLIHPDDCGEVFERVDLALEHGSSTEAEWRVVWPDGTVRWLAGHCKVFTSRSGKPMHMTGINIDLTERKRAEQAREDLLTQVHALNADLEDRVRSRTAQLTTTLAEREVLLQEVHHRVKNNLQVISSLISMQIRRLVDAASRSALEECKARIVAIALIHEKLYQSQDYARVPFSDYVTSLATNIFHATGVSPTNITLGVDIESVLLPVDKAIPCGLILNELIGNALKHAFPAARSGSVRVELRTTPGGDLLLAVSDDGVGMPADGDLNPARTLGMQLVSTLVKQLDGQLDVVRQDGTSFRVTLPLDHHATSPAAAEALVTRGE